MTKVFACSGLQINQNTKNQLRFVATQQSKDDLNRKSHTEMITDEIKSSDEQNTIPATTDHDQPNTITMSRLKWETFEKIVTHLQLSHPTIFDSILMKALNLTESEFNDIVVDDGMSACDTSTVFTDPKPDMEIETAGNMMVGARNQQRDAFLKARIGEGIDDTLRTMKKEEKIDCKGLVNEAKKNGNSQSFIELLETYPGEVGLVWRSLRAIKDLVMNDKEKRLFARGGGIELIIDSMRNYERCVR